MLRSIVVTFAVGFLANNSIAADIAVPPPVFTQLPAVDGINGKVEGFGGGAALRGQSPGLFGGVGTPWRGGAGAAASISAPLTPSLGVQIDGIAATTFGRPYLGAAGHVFARDPARGLFGAYGSVAHFGVGNTTQGRIGVEAEGYLGVFTISGLLGAETGRRSPGAPIFGATPFGFVFLPGGRRQATHFFDKIDLSVYAMDNLKLSVGHRYTNRLHAAAFGAEYLLPVGGATGVSLFAEGRVGERRYAAVLGGLRVYFGNSAKTLIRRHREDDPVNHLADGTLDSPDRNQGSPPATIFPAQAATQPPVQRAD